MFNGINNINSIVSNLTGGYTGLRGISTSVQNAEDFNKLRMITRQLVRKDFQKQWQFRIELEGEPHEFDLYVKDISYSTIEDVTENDSYGGLSMAWPIGIELVKLSMTVRDDESGTIQHFIDSWIEKAVHKDGTVGLPYGPLGYVKKVKKYIVTDKDERLSEEWEMYPTTRGDVSQSRENGDFTEFPVTFIQFSPEPR